MNCFANISGKTQVLYANITFLPFTTSIQTYGSEGGDEGGESLTITLGGVIGPGDAGLGTSGAVGAGAGTGTSSCEIGRASCRERV